MLTLILFLKLKIKKVRIKLKNIPAPPILHIGVLCNFLESGLSNMLYFLKYFKINKIVTNEILIEVKKIKA